LLGSSLSRPSYLRGVLNPNGHVIFRTQKVLVVERILDVKVLISRLSSTTLSIKIVKIQSGTMNLKSKKKKNWIRNETFHMHKQILALGYFVAGHFVAGNFVAGRFIALISLRVVSSRIVKTCESHC
jgi:hypothetical protein